MSWGPHLSLWLVLDVWLWPSTILRMGKQTCRLLSVTGNLHRGGSQQTSAAMPCCPRQTTNHLSKCQANCWNMKMLLGLPRESFQTQGSPRMWASVAVIMTSTCPLIRFLAGSLQVIYHCAAEKSLRDQTTCLQPVSLGAHKAEINEWWLRRESGNRTAAILGSRCQSRS